MLGSMLLASVSGIPKFCARDGQCDVTLTPVELVGDEGDVDGCYCCCRNTDKTAPSNNNKNNTDTVTNR